MTWGEMKALAQSNSVPDDMVVFMAVRDGNQTPSFDIPGFTFTPAEHRKEVDEFDVRGVAR